MRDDEEVGSVEGLPAGDDETAKHPANDPAPSETGEFGVAGFRDREARLAKEAGGRSRADGLPSADDDATGET